MKVNADSTHNPAQKRCWRDEEEEEEEDNPLNVGSVGSSFPYDGPPKDGMATGI